MSVDERAIDRRFVRQLDRAKDALVGDFHVSDDVRERMVKLAVSEAAAIAWQIGLPQLVFPTLADEKIESVNRWVRKQERIRQQGHQARLAA